jgi:hypothetical protein
MAIEELIKKIASESGRSRSGRSGRKSYSTNIRQLLGTWFVGLVLSLIPSVLTFLQLPLEKLGFLMFFNNVEMLYTCVTMTYVVVTTCLLLKSQGVGLINILAIILNALFFGALKTDAGTRFPIFENGTNLGIFIFILFSISVVINIGSFCYMHYMPKYLNARKVK